MTANVGGRSAWRHRFKDRIARGLPVLGSSHKTPGASDSVISNVSGSPMPPPPLATTPALPGEQPPLPTPSPSPALALGAATTDGAGVNAFLSRMPLQFPTTSVRVMTSYRLLLHLRALASLSEEWEARGVLVKAFDAAVALSRLVTVYALEKHGIAAPSAVPSVSGGRGGVGLGGAALGPAVGVEASASPSTADSGVRQPLALLDLSAAVLSAVDARKREVCIAVMCRGADLLRRMGHVQSVRYYHTSSLFSCEGMLSHRYGSHAALIAHGPRLLCEGAVLTDPCPVVVMG